MKDTTQRTTSALIVAPPGRLRDGLQTIVRAMPEIHAVDRTDDGPSALRLMTERPSALVFLDTDLVGNMAWTVLRQIKARWPHTRCIVLVNNGSQRQLVNLDGADAVLVKGFSTRTLNETIAELLPSIEGVTGGD